MTQMIWSGNAFLQWSYEHIPEENDNRQDMYNDSFFNCFSAQQYVQNMNSDVTRTV